MLPRPPDLVIAGLYESQPNLKLVDQPNRLHAPNELEFESDSESESRSESSDKNKRFE